MGRVGGRRELGRSNAGGTVGRVGEGRERGGWSGGEGLGV